ncbi:hypothetical protein Q5P01_000355 [Channa striata]|uniref:TNFR-Cys domain-containing protein n=1 Tax=Channa striata TaxID=64152 RepID=A0AA88IC57_CHASR|nr:hypothetical protein Q5P01_000355 [Channa striata]
MSEQACLHCSVCQCVFSTEASSVLCASVVMNFCIRFLSLYSTSVFHISKHSSCKPHIPEYLTETGCCPRCSVGSRVKTDCKESRPTSCLPCLEGTYMNKPSGLKYCFSCTNCDEGSGLKKKKSCRTTSDTVCEPLDGFYCVDSTENSCARANQHRRCEPGQYVSSKGTASSDTLCSRCPDGTFSDGTSTICQPHTQCESKNLLLKRPGNVSTDAECGEHSLNVTIIVISVFVPFLFIVFPVFLLLYRRKKLSLPCLKGKIHIQEHGKVESWQT